jgi:RNA polymerase sigma-70 factor (ECF subfamily)
VPAQRAVLILRDVVGLSAREMAGQLGTSVPAVTSAAARPRRAGGPPPRPDAASGAAFAWRRAHQGAGRRHADAIERGDADLLVSMLTSDATWTMPPESACIRGPAAIREFIRADVSPQRWRHRATRANGQLAIGCYIRAAGRAAHEPWVPDMLTLDGGQIAGVHPFIVAEHVRQPGYDGRFTTADFARSGLPASLPGPG